MPVLRRAERKLLPIVALVLVIACTRDQTPRPLVKTVLIIGNSITHHTPAPEKGWFGDWGMAASDSTKDYVHLLQDKIKKINPEVNVHYTGGGALFERDYAFYNPKEIYGEFLALGPDLVILRIGENVADSAVFQNDFEGAFSTLVRYFEGIDHRPVICVGSFWRRPNTSLLMKKVASNLGHSYIDLQDLSRNASRQAFSEFEDSGVGSHPNDRGMADIADRIWTRIEIYFAL